MTRTMKELSDFHRMRVSRATARCRCSGVASTASARAEDLIYVESARHLESAAASASLCVTYRARALELPGKALIRFRPIRNWPSRAPPSGLSQSLPSPRESIPPPSYQLPPKSRPERLWDRMW